MAAQPIIVWMRRDLRIEDNPALHAACETGKPVLPVFVNDETEAFAPGAAARWWLYHSLASLAVSLKKAGSKLTLRRGDAPAAIKSLVADAEATGVYWNRRYVPEHVEADKALIQELKASGLDVQSFNGNLLREPWELKTGSGGHYKVFTPMWRAMQNAGPAGAAPLPGLHKIQGPEKYPPSDALEDWALLASNPDWAKDFNIDWTPGESGAQQRLGAFLNDAVTTYDEDRNRPDIAGTSGLSPHLAFGEISPLQIWQVTHQRMEAGDIPSDQAMKFLSEVTWREFAHTLLYHYQDLRTKPLRPEYENFPWEENPEHLRAWQKGLTGYPIVDAGMRELWRTGWMHNRVRMIVASFLIKHLLTPWQRGEEWFWDTLVDADPANNSASWQWIAGCGADGAPYFRIFNPIAQGEKFDPDGTYTRKYVPELAALPNKYLQKPWDAPDDIVKQAKVDLGQTYPLPIVDHAMARQRALDAFERIKKT